MARKATQLKTKSDEPDRIEWVLAAICGATVVLLFGFLLVEAAVIPDTPPTINVTAEGSRVVQGQTYVEVSVQNSGSEAAADVEIEGSANGESNPISHASLDYAPPDSDAVVTLVFSGTVARSDIAVRVVGFGNPDPFLTLAAAAIGPWHVRQTLFHATADHAPSRRTSPCTKYSPV